MLALIPLIKNDYLLTLFYLIIILVSLLIKYEKKDIIFLTFGLIAMFLGEVFFLKTNVETFNRNSLFNIMPLWLPFLWAYVFVIIKRSINILK
jgi:hypothetical protein